MSPWNYPKIDSYGHLQQIHPETGTGSTPSREGSAAPQAKLQLMQQGSVIEDGVHSPCLGHFLQGQAQNLGQMGEQGVCGGTTALPNLPVYVVHHIDGEGCSCTLHKSYLLPISNNLEQGECKSSVGGDRHNDKPTLMPHEKLDSMHNSPSKQYEPFDSGSTGSISMDPTGERLQADNDTPVPLRKS